MRVRATVGRVFGALGLACAVAGIFVLDGVSIELPGIVLAALAYYFGLTGRDRLGRILGVAAAVVNVVSVGVSGLEAPLQ